VSAIAVDWAEDCAGRAFGDGMSRCDVQVRRPIQVGASFLDRQCSPDGWCWYNPLPRGFGSRSLWPLAGGGYAAADGQGVLRCSGTACTALPSDNQKFLNAVWAS